MCVLVLAGFGITSCGSQAAGNPETAGTPAPNTVIPTTIPTATAGSSDLQTTPMPTPPMSPSTSVDVGIGSSALGSDGLSSSETDGLGSSESSSSDDVTSDTSEEPTEQTTPDDGATTSDDDSESSGPQVLPSTASGRTLGLADVFSAVGEWNEARFDIADASNLFGMATELKSGCGTPQPAELELRLAHRFKNLKMKVGQANNSLSSDEVVVVDVVKNGKQLDSQKVPFDKVQSFDEDITDANSLKLSFTLSENSCSGNSSVFIVVEALTVS